MPNWLASVLQSVLDVSNVLNTSMAASWLVLVVIVLRFLLKKAPKWTCVALWGMVAVRLLMPFSIESACSLLPSVEIVSDELLQAGPVTGAQPAYLELVTNPGFGRTVTMELNQSISSFQWDLLSWTWIWLAGMGVMALYAGISCWRLYRSVQTAVRLRDHIFQSETVVSPFVLGIWKPRIYLPFQMDGENLEYVVFHEQAHIRRKDHWWKPLGFLLLAVHWFNPLMWLAFVLLCRDMELACDEKVIRELGREQRADYAQALVACSVSRRPIGACPLAFGEIGVRERVKSVMNYKKPGFWVAAAAVAICLFVAVCFLTNPVDPEQDLSFLNYKNAIPVVADMDEIMAIYCPSSDNGSGASIQIGVVSGADLAKQLDRWAWNVCEAPRNDLPSPGSVEFIVEEDYRIIVHHRKSGALRQYAVVKYEDEIRYYSIDRSDYPDAVALVHAPALHASKDTRLRYSLIIGTGDIKRIEIKTPDSSGGCENADGSLFKKGEQVWLEPLDGYEDLRGVSITALDSVGDVAFSVCISDYFDSGIPKEPLVCGDWIITPEYHL